MSEPAAEPEVSEPAPQPEVAEATAQPESTMAPPDGEAEETLVQPAPPEAPAEAAAPEAPAEAEVTQAPIEAEAPERLGEPVAAEPLAEPETTEPPAEEEAKEAVVEAAPSTEPAAEVPAQEPPEAPKEPKSDDMNWYILKVQSNREDSIRDGLLRRVKIAGLEPYFGQIIVPTEQVTEFKGGKKRVTTRKLYPGYLVVQMEINDDTWFLVRETPGIGDFTGAAGHPTPMQPHEVSRILAKQEEKGEEAPKLRIAFHPGDKVKINDGTFESFEGEVERIDETNGRVTVLITIFGRPTPVELEYWQIESL